MRYLPKSPADRQQMLREIGIKSIDELFAPIPAEYRQRLLNAIQRGERVYPAIEAAGLS